MITLICQQIMKPFTESIFLPSKTVRLAALPFGMPMGSPNHAMDLDGDWKQSVGDRGTVAKAQYGQYRENSKANSDNSYLQRTRVAL